MFKSVTAKVGVFAVLLFICDVLLALVLGIINMLNIVTVGLLLILLLGGVFFRIYKVVLQPLEKLKNALTKVDFSLSRIDFTEFDNLKIKSGDEFQFLYEKYAYLSDILVARIQRVNDETYKSEHDGLTGLYNRAKFNNMRNKYETSSSVFICYIDVNNLKKMNDMFGHDAGDALIKNASKKLEVLTEQGFDVYRMGGDEFMVVMINQQKDYCSDMIKAWYPTVGCLNRESDGFKCLMAIGVSFSFQPIKLEKLIEQADTAMYKHKSSIKKKYGESER